MYIFQICLLLLDLYDPFIKKIDPKNKTGKMYYRNTKMVA